MVAEEELTYWYLAVVLAQSPQVVSFDEGFSRHRRVDRRQVCVYLESSLSF